ncbi:nucleotidyltransferase domain-containing protein [Azospirillum sp. Sh1]|uniref:nucleotidyltransferase domain-containing protein n=1 Tax=Azospirillum sp. Sh1 TaxID=2607285 RepID=UPI0011F0763C|nr:nucleotidyltransferase domain-containing protein [Azospirillum sp. Sh1]KAA0570022.1 hypothetical protein FZ029_31935 [Azospirillum sp. Sh1]
MSSDRNILDVRKSLSEARISELRRRIVALDSAENFPLLTIFSAGSYARNEASQYSDVDLFFLYDRPSRDYKHSRIAEIKLFSDIVKISEEMGFPELSNDGEYLKILYLDENLAELGGRGDDYQNHFTTRMLLLLESKPLFNDDNYWAAVARVIDSYFRDYGDHASEFRPIFLVNDIQRFWKTLCLNYEHKRNQPEADQEKRIKQKIKNFKLKHSRLLTCFASIAYLSSFPKPMRPEDVIDMISLTPLQRLEYACDNTADLEPLFVTARKQYVWFLEMTALPTDDLYAWFLDDANRSLAFQNAKQFGDTIFEILREVTTLNNYLRSIVL